MSKASEWATALSDAQSALAKIERDSIPRLFLPDGTGSPVAWVDTRGEPYFDRVRGRWTVEDAITLARWILDTFGEEP